MVGFSKIIIKNKRMPNVITFYNYRIDCDRYLGWSCIGGFNEYDRRKCKLVERI